MHSNMMEDAIDAVCLFFAFDVFRTNRHSLKFYITEVSSEAMYVLYGRRTVYVPWFYVLYKYNQSKIEFMTAK